MEVWKGLDLLEVLNPLIDIEHRYLLLHQELKNKLILTKIKNSQNLFPLKLKFLANNNQKKVFLIRNQTRIK